MRAYRDRAFTVDAQNPRSAWLVHTFTNLIFVQFFALEIPRVDDQSGRYCRLRVTRLCLRVVTNCGKHARLRQSSTRGQSLRDAYNIYAQ